MDTCKHEKIPTEDPHEPSDGETAKANGMVSLSDSDSETDTEAEFHEQTQLLADEDNQRSRNEFRVLVCVFSLCLMMLVLALRSCILGVHHHHANPNSQLHPGQEYGHRANAPNFHQHENLVELSSLQRHLKALQVIADTNGGTRCISGPGFNASRDYVISALSNTGFSIHVQSFPVRLFEHVSPPRLIEMPHYANPKQYTHCDRRRDSRTPTSACAFNPMGMEGIGTVQAPVQEVLLWGCSSFDYLHVQGKIALIKRGFCSFHEKALYV